MTISIVFQRNRTRHSMIAVLAGALVLATAGCGGSQSSGASNGSSDSPITIGYIPNQNAPFFLAQEKKLYEAHGLNPTFIKFESGPPEFAALQSGDVDVTDIGALPFIIGLSNGIPMQYVMSAFQANTTNAIIGNKDINSPSDLRGKKVAVTVGSSGSLMLGRALEKAGMTEKDVTIVNTPPGNMVPSFLHGDVAAVASWWPWIDQTVQNGGHVVTTMEAAGAFVPDVWAARKSFAEKSPDTLTKFVSAMNDATNQQIKDPKAIAGTMASKLGIDQTLVESAISLPIYAPADQQMSPKYVLSMANATNSSGLAGVLQTDAGFLLSINKITKVPDLVGAQNTAPLKAVLAGR